MWWDVSGVVTPTPYGVGWKKFRRQGGLKFGTLRVREHFCIATHDALTLSRLGGGNIFQPRA